MLGFPISSKIFCELQQCHAALLNLTKLTTMSQSDLIPLNQSFEVPTILSWMKEFMDQVRALNYILFEKFVFCMLRCACYSVYYLSHLGSCFCQPSNLPQELAELAKVM